MIELSKTDSETIFNGLKESVYRLGLSLQDCIGYGSDAANVVSGFINSVWTHVKSKAPEAIQFTCICHSLAKVMEKGFEELPSHIAYLLKKIPSILLCRSK